MLGNTRAWLGSLLLACALTNLCMLAMPATAHSQELDVIPKEKLLALGDGDVRHFLSTALEAGLPKQVIGQVYLLSRKRSELAVPELTSALNRALHNTAANGVFIRKVADVLAYAADETALDELIRLGVLDHNQFGYFISRALDYAQGVRNPYALAYHGFGLYDGDSRTDDDIVRWVKANARKGAGYRLWAAAIVERAESRGERLVSALAVSNDLLVARTGSGPSEELLQEVESLLAAKSRTQ